MSTEFCLFWLNGEKEIVKGESISDAFAKAGYGGGALNTLDFYSNTKDDFDKYEFDSSERSWKRKQD